MKKDYSPLITIIVAIISGIFLLLNTYLEHKLNSNTLPIANFTPTPQVGGKPNLIEPSQAEQFVSIGARIGEILLWLILILFGSASLYFLWKKKLLQLITIMLVFMITLALIGTFIASNFNASLIGALMGCIIGGVIGYKIGYGWWKNQPKDGRKPWI